MVYGYQERDREVMDYRSYYIPPVEIQFRGPKPELKKGQYAACIGAAQTFGCYCEDPYPELLGKKLNTPFLNFGLAGAGPSTFLQPTLLDHINDSKLAIVQVMSGRSASNSLFIQSGGHIIKRSDNSKVPCNIAYQELIDNTDLETLKKIISETRTNWINDYKDLLGRIGVPVILFWFSKRKPDYKEKYDNVKSLFNDFPQLVNSGMVGEIRNHCAEYVECISKRGWPNKLFSRFTGRKVIITPDVEDEKPYSRNYYPSPEMHMDAAAALEPICRKYLFGEKNG